MSAFGLNRLPLGADVLYEWSLSSVQWLDTFLHPTHLISVYDKRLPRVVALLLRLLGLFRPLGGRSPCPSTSARLRRLPLPLGGRALLLGRQLGYVLGLKEE